MSGTELTTVARAAIEQHGESFFTPGQIELITRTLGRDLAPDELAICLYDAARRRLDPLLGQLHFIPRGRGDNRRVSRQVSIDGLGLIAARSGVYAGMEAPLFHGETTYGDDEGGPAVPQWVEVTVYRLVQGQRCPFTGVAYWREFRPAAGQDAMWQRMPHIMLAKCARAQALRAAFPEELTGLYADDEMAQAEPTAGSTSGRGAVAAESRPVHPGPARNGEVTCSACAAAGKHVSVASYIAVADGQGGWLCPRHAPQTETPAQAAAAPPAPPVATVEQSVTTPEPEPEPEPVPLQELLIQYRTLVRHCRDQGIGERDIRELAGRATRATLDPEIARLQQLLAAVRGTPPAEV